MHGEPRRSIPRAARWPGLAVVSVCWLWPWRSAAQAPPAGPPVARMVHLAGVVVGPDGQPVPGAQVGVISSGTAHDRLDSVFTGKCDETGGFDLEVEDAERFPDMLVAYYVWARSVDGTLMGAHTASDNPPDEPIAIRLQPPGHVHAKVVDPKGGPLAGVSTSVVLHSGSAGAVVEGPSTNAQGEVLVGPLPAETPLSLRPGFGLNHLALDDPWGRAFAKEPLVLQPGQIYELPALTLDPDGRSVQGVLVDADGKPLPGAEVASHLPQWPVNSATADEQGRFTLTGLPVKGHDVWLLAEDPAGRLYLMSPVDPDQGEEVRLVLRPLTSAGGVLARADGQPLGDVVLMVFPFLRCRMGHEGISYMGWQMQGVPPRIEEPLRPAADGSWSIGEMVAGGQYTLQLQSPGLPLELGEGAFEVDREGRPTDCGLMLVQ